MSVILSQQELDDMYQAALEVARAAGELIKAAFQKEKCVQTKENPADLVTETDQLVEKTTFETLRAKFPTHRFIGEESQSETQGHCEWTDEPTWIVDPVDGTTNFVHSVAEVAFSLGVTVNKKPVIGVVCMPIKNEMYTAREGQGAFLNGTKLTANSSTDLKRCLVITEAGSQRDPKVLADKIQNIHSLVTHSHGVRAYGSAAYNLCCVAAGRADLYLEFGVHIWDFVAGALVALEAGATVADPNGGDLDYLSRRILCTCTPQLVKQVSDIILQVDMGRD